MCCVIAIDKVGQIYFGEDGIIFLYGGKSGTDGIVVVEERVV